MERSAASQSAANLSIAPSEVPATMTLLAGSVASSAGRCSARSTRHILRDTPSKWLDQ
jgi:hypothetical protein